MPKFKKPVMSLQKSPESLDFGPEAGSSVELSAFKLKFTGIGNKDEVSITFNIGSGTFESLGSNKIDVTGSGTGTITFTGSAKDIEKFFKSSGELSMTPDLETPSTGTTNFSMSGSYAGTTTDLFELDVTVPEVESGPTEILGTEQNDTIEGTSGDDIIDSLGGDDTVDGFAGNDHIKGGAGDDDISGGEGADTLEGGAGEDTVQYFGSDAGIIADLNVDASGFQSIVGGHADGDVISEFENVYATDFDDQLLGNAEDNVLFGYAGNDVIDGGAGDDVIRGGADADTLIGGAGDDWLRYLGSTEGVDVNLTLGSDGLHQTAGGDAEGDIASGFENLSGSDFDDVLTGDADANRLVGEAGDDVIDGGAGNDVVYGDAGADIIDGGAGNDVIQGGAGVDVLEGGAGTDTLDYDQSETGVTVDLSLAAGTGQTSAGDASGDIVSGFENLSGSEFDDNLTGDSGRNYLYGLEGNDTLDGGAGNDVVRGGEGADVMTGGTGSDVLHFGGSTAGVSVNLVADAAGFQQASGGDAEGDVISGFEHVYATNFDDVLVGNDARNILYGYGGDDTFDGGLGNDVLRGSSGEDTFVFSTELGAGNVDRIVDFSSADDIFNLSEEIFTGLALGALDASAFVPNATGLAETADQHVVFNSATGELLFDSDGSGGADGVVFATLTAGLGIDETDFFLV